MVRTLCCWTILFSGTTAACLADDVVSLKLGPPEPFPQRLFTFNTNMLTATAFKGIGYDDPVFRQAVRSLKPNGLRFPGGTIANNYLWQKDSFSPPVNDKTGWAGQQLELFRKIGRPYNLPGFAAVCRDHGVSPIWVLNIFEETPETVLALFEKFDALGLDVEAIEFGNEPYWDGRTFNDVRRYIDLCRPLASAIKGVHPEVKIGACFAPLNNPANYEAIWNRPLAKQHWYDAVIYHDYFGGQGFVLEPGATVPVDAMLNPAAMVDTPVQHFKKELPGKPIWLTEWNVGTEGLKQWKNTGAELLFIAAMMNSLVEYRGAIEWACFHEIYGTDFGTFFVDDRSGLPTRNASWELFRLLGIATANAEHLRPIMLDSKTLSGFAAETDGETRLVLVNFAKHAQALALPSKIGANLTHLSLRAGRDAQLPTNANLLQRYAVNPAALALPADSINVIATDDVLPSTISNTVARNLFPARPYLNFWYAPFARQQPRFDETGTFAVDFNDCRDKNFAVVKMPLGALGLTAGQQCELVFDVRADEAIGLVSKLPSVSAVTDSNDGTHSDRFVPIGTTFETVRFHFHYDPETNTNEVTFVFTEEMLKTGTTVEFRNFRISEVGSL